ncbi:hypothetical protein RRG08_026568 [Elysia crispata]|uniref:Uncharacterized protein n=1 Tax=Elysia crispata TaxID=231223 RepID=A0AAE0Y3W5_9GAST|nr:hypothetical protein RRG08_026568 [Elysia crispata]
MWVGHEQIMSTDPECIMDGSFWLWSVYILLVISCVGAGNLYMRSYFPTIAVSQGATLDQAAMMVILVGLLDLISRLSLGFLADTHMLKSS